MLEVLAVFVLLPMVLLSLYALGSGQAKLWKEVETFHADLQRLRLDVALLLRMPVVTDVSRGPNIWTFKLRLPTESIEVSAATENEAIMELVKRNVKTSRVVSIHRPPGMAETDPGPKTAA